MQQPRQRVVYIRVTKMLLPRSNPNVARNLFQQIQPGYSGVISPLMPIQMLDMYSTTAIPAFRFHDQRKSSVTFIVTELTQFGEKEACRLCLPISWFPHGYVVHHYFPFITKTPDNGTPFIELDVHVADIQTTPFSAYYGTLTVIPTWIPPPQMTEGATVLIPQQVKIQQPVQQQNQNVQQQPQQNQKNKEQNAANDANLTANKDKNKHHHHTHIDDEVSDESEIMLDDLDDVLTDESANQNPPPVLDQSKTNDKQQPRKLFQIPDPEPEQPFEQQPSQKQSQKQPSQQNQQQTFQHHQFQQQNQQFQQQPYQQQQFQQQSIQQQNQYQQQQLQQHLLPQSQTTQPNKVHYPPFPPLSNQQEFQEQQNHVETKNDHGKTAEEKKKLSNPM